MGGMRQATPAERSAFGRRDEGQGAPFEPRRVGAPGRPDRPPGDPRPPGHHPDSRPGSDPLRPDGGVRLRLLPRCGRGDGRRSQPRGPQRARCPVVRRCAPVQLRRLRLSRAGPDLRRQRLRRDAARALRVGPQAPGRQPRDRGAEPRVRRHDPPVDRGPGLVFVPHGHPGVRRACAISRSGTSHLDAKAIDERWGGQASSQDAGQRPAPGGQGPVARTISPRWPS